VALALFSWGYWGWGTATRQLVKSFDIAEQERGFQPPVFVDCRLRRQGRAKGFVGDSFKDLVGKSRYEWMQGLGNNNIATGGKGVTIKNPSAVGNLFDLAQRTTQERRRVIFYCACEYQSDGDELKCHRHAITTLLLAYARKVGRSISVVEWPGGEPAKALVELDQKLFADVMRGRKSVPLASARLKDFAGLPWGSALEFRCKLDGRSGFVMVGPPKFATQKDDSGYWYLPVLGDHDPGVSKDSMLSAAKRWRRERGLDPRTAA